MLAAIFGMLNVGPLLVDGLNILLKTRGSLLERVGFRTVCVSLLDRVWLLVFVQPTGQSRLALALVQLGWIGHSLCPSGLDWA